MLNLVEKIVIGIDPGTATVGYAICSGTKKTPTILDYGVLHTEPLPKEKMPNRLLEIGNDLELLLIKFKPTHAIIEDLFFLRTKPLQLALLRVGGFYFIFLQSIMFQFYL